MKALLNKRLIIDSQLCSNRTWIHENILA